MLKPIKTIIILIIVALITGWVFYTYQITASVSSSEEIVLFEIEHGEGVNQISQNLHEQGLIRNEFYFEVYVWQNRLERNFIASVHEVSSSMNIKEIVTKLTSVGESELSITIIEGWNNKEIAEYLEKKELVTSNDFLNLVGKNLSQFVSQYEFLADKPSQIDLEGYLFPDTYRVFKNASATEVVRKMLDNFDDKLSADLREKIQKQKRTIFEIITLASIIEKEVSNPDDMKMVADIFYKRLKTNIALQSDATVNYITHKGLTQPSIADTKINDPYNTYMYPGLPPGPIANPGLNAIIAAIEPTHNEYYYFLTTKEGKAIYSKNYDEHLENKYKYLD